MKYFISFIIFTIYIFGFTYHNDPFEELENEEYIETNRSSEFEEEIEYITVQSLVPYIQYIDLKQAIKEAKNEKKFVFIKIESNNCDSCAKLNEFLDNNENVRSMVNNRTKAVKLNLKYDTIPPKLSYIGTPTIFLVNPNSNRLLMKLEGSETVDVLEESLKDIVYDD